MDYEDPFAPIEKMTTLCLLLIVTSIKWVWKMSSCMVSYTRLYIWSLPQGKTNLNLIWFFIFVNFYMVSRSTTCSIWEISSTIINDGFCLCISDYSLFIWLSNTGVTILLRYMDDMIITGNNKNGIVQLKNHLNSTFKMKDLGRLRYFFGARGWIFVGWYNAKPK